MSGPRRRIVFVCAILAVALLLIGSGSFTAATVDRGVSVTVVDHEEGLLAVETTEHELPNGNHEISVPIENRMGEPVDLSVTHADPPGEFPNVQRVTAPDRLDIGAAATIDLRLVCSTSATQRSVVPIHVEAHGDATSVELTVDLSISCTGDPPGN